MFTEVFAENKYIIIQIIFKESIIYFKRLKIKRVFDIHVVRNKQKTMKNLFLSRVQLTCKKWWSYTMMHQRLHLI